MFDQVQANSGSFVGGLLAGFFCGCIGLVLVLVMGGEETKRGAIYGFFASMILSALSIGMQAMVATGY